MNAYIYPGVDRNRFNLSWLACKQLAIERVARVMGLDPDKIKSKSRRKRLTEARMIVCYILRYIVQPGLSLTEIGVSLRRDHSTVTHNLKCFHTFYTHDRSFRMLVDEVLDEYGVKGIR